jgi:hypothetical protein
MSETKSIVERLEMEADVSDFRISKGIKLYSGPILRAIAAELREIAGDIRVWRAHVTTHGGNMNYITTWADRISRREEPK